MFSLYLCAQETLSAFVEGLKQRASVTKLTNIMKEEVPALYGALIGKADRANQHFYFHLQFIH
jgi:hypothetical protein